MNLDCPTRLPRLGAGWGEVGRRRPRMDVLQVPSWTRTLCA